MPDPTPMNREKAYELAAELQEAMAFWRMKRVNSTAPVLSPSSYEMNATAADAFDEKLQRAAAALRQLADDAGDAATLRGYINTYRETPTMTWSRAAKFEAELAALREERGLDHAGREILTEAAERIEALEKALQAVLLFHSGSPWTPEGQRVWKEITGKDEATTKVLCDHIRSNLPVPEVRGSEAP